VAGTGSKSSSVMDFGIGGVETWDFATAVIDWLSSPVNNIFNPT
jgi:hypothetical protein